MVGSQRLISWLHPCSTSNMVLNMCTLGKYPEMFPLGASPYVKCQRHMPYRVSLTGHTCTICPHTGPYVRLWGTALIPFVTPCPQCRIIQPFRGASPLKHSTSLTLSSSLRIKESTRRCYDWRTKAYKLASPLLARQARLHIAPHLRFRPRFA